MSVRRLLIASWVILLLTLAGCAERQAHPKAQPPGMGAAPHPHSVQLNWQAPPVSAVPPVQKYTVFRAVAKKRTKELTLCGKFKPIATVDASSTTYKDTSVTPGQLYCYYVKSSTTAGESGPSATVTALIPKE